MDSVSDAKDANSMAEEPSTASETAMTSPADATTEEAVKEINYESADVEYERKPKKNTKKTADTPPPAEEKDPTPTRRGRPSKLSSVNVPINGSILSPPRTRSKSKASHRAESPEIGQSPGVDTSAEPDSDNFNKDATTGDVDRVEATSRGPSPVPESSSVSAKRNRSNKIEEAGSASVSLRRSTRRATSVKAPTETSTSVTRRTSPRTKTSPNNQAEQEKSTSVRTRSRSKLQKSTNIVSEELEKKKENDNPESVEGERDDAKELGRIDVEREEAQKREREEAEEREREEAEEREREEAEKREREEAEKREREEAEKREREEAEEREREESEKREREEAEKREREEAEKREREEAEKREREEAEKREREEAEKREREEAEKREREEAEERDREEVEEREREEVEEREREEAEEREREEAEERDSEEVEEREREEVEEREREREEAEEREREEAEKREREEAEKREREEAEKREREEAEKREREEAETREREEAETREREEAEKRPLLRSYSGDSSVPKDFSNSSEETNTKIKNDTSERIAKSNSSSGIVARPATGRPSFLRKNLGVSVLKTPDSTGKSVSPSRNTADKSATPNSKSIRDYNDDEAEKKSNSDSLKDEKGGDLRANEGIYAKEISPPPIDTLADSKGAKSPLNNVVNKQTKKIENIPSPALLDRKDRNSRDVGDYLENSEKGAKLGETETITSGYNSPRRVVKSPRGITPLPVMVSDSGKAVTVISPKRQSGSDIGNASSPRPLSPRNVAPLPKMVSPNGKVHVVSPRESSIAVDYDNIGNLLLSINREDSDNDSDEDPEEKMERLLVSKSLMTTPANTAPTHAVDSPQMRATDSFNIPRSARNLTSPMRASASASFNNQAHLAQNHAAPSMRLRSPTGQAIERPRNEQYSTHRAQTQSPYGVSARPAPLRPQYGASPRPSAAQPQYGASPRPSAAQPQYVAAKSKMSSDVRIHPLNMAGAASAGIGIGLSIPSAFSRFKEQKRATSNPLPTARAAAPNVQNFEELEKTLNQQHAALSSAHRRERPMFANGRGMTPYNQLHAMPDFDSMSTSERAYTIIRYKLNLSKYAQENQNLGITAEQIQNADLPTLHSMLTAFTDTSRVASRVDTYKFWYCTALILVELFLTKFLGFRTAVGFADSQISLISCGHYDALLTELGEKKSFTGSFTAAPVEVRVGIALGINALVYIVLYIVANKMPKLIRQKIIDETFPKIVNLFSNYYAAQPAANGLGVNAPAGPAEAFAGQTMLKDMKEMMDTATSFMKMGKRDDADEDATRRDARKPQARASRPRLEQ